MNSRRLMVAPCRGNPAYHIVERKLCCAVQQIRAINDGFGSEAAGRHVDHIRFASKADKWQTVLYVRFVPIADLVGLSEGHVYHKLALGRMAGNVPLACRILRQHDAPCGKSADVAIARLKFDLAG